MNLFDIIGWLGSGCLAVCALPQVYLTFKTKNVSSLSFPMLVSWSLGCLFALVYGLHVRVPTLIIVSYIVNGGAAFALVIAYLLYRKK